MRIIRIVPPSMGGGDKLCRCALRSANLAHRIEIYNLFFYPPSGEEEE